MSNETPSYRDGWRPEQSLKDSCFEMLKIVFDPECSVDKASAASLTLIEIINPEIMEEATKLLAEEWEKAIDQAKGTA
jgi:hypothetical protein